LQIYVDPKLSYDALMSVIDICTRQKLAGGEPLSRITSSKCKPNSAFSEYPRYKPSFLATADPHATSPAIDSPKFGFVAENYRVCWRW